MQTVIIIYYIGFNYLPITILHSIISLYGFISFYNSDNHTDYDYWLLLLFYITSVFWIQQNIH